MLLVYNYVLLKMSTWYSKHVEESNNIWRVNNIQCITLVVLYGQFMMHGQRNIKPWRSWGLEVQLRECLSLVLGGGVWPASGLRRFNSDVHWLDKWVGSKAGMDTLQQRMISYPYWDGTPTPRLSLINLITTPIEIFGSRRGLFRRKSARNVLKVEVTWILWQASFTVLC